MTDERPTFGSLFAGIGGIDLGLERAGWRGRWQVEYEPFCQRVLARHWPDVARYGDICDVDWGGVEPVDLVAGGFPCQPFSVAGKQRGMDDDRWLWPEFERCLRALRPRYVLVENVPGLLVGRGMDAVLGGLADLGYDTEWECIPAAAVGAPHLRYRVWIIAHRQADAPRPDTDGIGPHRAGVDEYRGAELRHEQVGEPRPVGWPLADATSNAGWIGDRDGEADVPYAHELGRQGERGSGLLDGIGAAFGDDVDGRGRALADADSRGREPGRSIDGRPLGGRRGNTADTSATQDAGSLAHPDASGRDGRSGDQRPGWRAEPADSGIEMADTTSLRPSGPREHVEPVDPAPSRDGQASEPRDAGWWSVEPDVGRVAHGVPARVDRLRSLGNAVVPQVVEFIGRRILEAEAVTA